MTTHRIADLTGDLLNAAVAKALKVPIGRSRDGRLVTTSYDENHLASPLPYSTEWRLGGPIIEREQIVTVPYRPDIASENIHWTASANVAYEGYIDDEIPFGDEDSRNGNGPTLLIAAMRAYVGSVFGEAVELP